MWRRMILAAGGCVYLGVLGVGIWLHHGIVMERKRQEREALRAAAAKRASLRGDRYLSLVRTDSDSAAS